MSFGPPRDGGQSQRFAPKRVHRLSDRFPQHPSQIEALKHLQSLRERLRYHLYAAEKGGGGVSWLDALLYERLFADRAAPSSTEASKKPAALGAPSDKLEVWNASLSSLEALVDTLDTLDMLRQKCTTAIERRCKIMEQLLSTTCFAARQVESRERDMRRQSQWGSPVVDSPVHNPLALNSSASASSSQSPVSYSLNNAAAASSPSQPTPVVVHHMWMNDVTRQFLYRISKTGFNPCIPHRSRMACSVDSHKHLAALLRALDDATDDVVMSIVYWRSLLHRPVPFLYEGHNILLMIQNELETVLAAAIAHLMDQAGGQPCYTVNECPFHHVSRYTGGLGGAVAVSSNPTSPTTPGGGTNAAPVVDPGTAKTLSYVVARELSLQLKYAEDCIRLVDERGFHVTPLLNVSCSEARAYAHAQGQPRSHKDKSSTNNDTFPTVVTRRLPSFMVDARGDPSLIRRHLQTSPSTIFPLPLVVEVPKNWFPEEILLEVTQQLCEETMHVKNNSNGRGGASKSLLAAAASVSQRGSLFSETSIAFGLGDSMMDDDGDLRDGEDGKASNSAFTLAIVVDRHGCLTHAGMWVLLHREQKQDSSVIQRTLQWIRDCYAQGRMILEEPFGSVVEPFLQQRLLDKHEEEEYLQQERVRALEAGEAFSRAAALKRLPKLRKSVMASAAEDYGRDETLDRLVVVCYADGASKIALRSQLRQKTGTPPPSAAPRHGDGGASVEDKEADTTHRDETLTPSEEATQKRLIILQRRSVKRFGLRMLRQWVRFHLHRLHRHEMTLDLLQKNQRQLLRRRYVTWLKLTLKRRSGRQLAVKLKVQSDTLLLKRRFTSWKILCLGKAVSRNFNAWLFQKAYFRWLFPVAKKRIERILARAAADMRPAFDGEANSSDGETTESTRPWLLGLAEVSTLIKGNRNRFLLQMAEMVKKANASAQ